MGEITIIKLTMICNVFTTCIVSSVFCADCV